jgi:hypothetical protein
LSSSLRWCCNAPTFYHKKSRQFWWRWMAACRGVWLWRMIASTLQGGDTNLPLVSY